MKNLFEVKVRYQRVDEKTGKEKKVTEKYLIDAVSFGEAEERSYKEMEQMIRGEFIVLDIKRTNYTELFAEEIGSIYYKGKLSFSSVDEKSGKERKISNYILVLAEDVDDAYKHINQAMKDTVVDFTVDGISDSKIMDVFLYNGKEE